MWLFKRKKKNEIEKVQNDNVIEEAAVTENSSKSANNDASFEEMYSYVQERIIQDDDVTAIDEKQNMLTSAMYGDVEAKSKMKEYIRSCIKESGKKVPGWTENSLVNEIFAYGWGLGVVEKYNEDNEIDEIRVNGPDNIYIVKKGKSYKVEDRFQNEEEVETVIKRMIINDVGISLDRSSPRIESVRKDGSRLTATCYPVTKTWTFILRKHTSFIPTLDNYIISKTLDKKVWKILSVLVRGRASLLISGNVGAGKTTLMQKLIGEHSDKLRILVIGKDLELRISEKYKERDIIELEEHPHVGASMKALFETALRESPDIIVIEEFRGGGEAIEAVRACTRGLPGSMATAHFNSAEESIEGTGLFMLEEGLNLTLDMAKLRVARAFNIVVQMFGDSITGQKKLTSITEVCVSDDGKITYNELVKWKPLVADNYLGDGNWEIVNRPTKKIINHLIKNVSIDELNELGWYVS